MELLFGMVMMMMMMCVCVCVCFVITYVTTESTRKEIVQYPMSVDRVRERERRESIDMCEVKNMIASNEVWTQVQRSHIIIIVVIIIVLVPIMSAKPDDDAKG